jgi:hypothetical protein
MSIQKTKLTNHLLVLPNNKYFLGEIELNNDVFKIIYTFNYDGLVEVHITAIGIFGFIFLDSGDLASIDVLSSSRDGLVPPVVIENENKINRLQQDRISFINFFAAAFFGRVSAKKFMSLTGSVYVGQDKFTGFYIEQGAVCIQPTEYVVRTLQEKIDALASREHQAYLLTSSDINDAVSYVKHLLERHKNFEYADLKTCIDLNYQAAILHNQQHFTASLALNVVVIESLVGEIFYIYGLINGTNIQQFATNQHRILSISKNCFNRKSLNELVEILHDGELFDDHLFERLSNIRKLRNSLLHKRQKITPQDSGLCLSVVRDLWSFCIDTPFELITGWSYRW